MMLLEPTIGIPVGVHYRKSDGQPFLVLTGRATVEPEGSDLLVYLSRGSVCTLPALTTAKWTISESIEIFVGKETVTVFKARDDEDDARETGAGPDPGVRPFQPRRYVTTPHG